MKTQFYVLTAVVLTSMLSFGEEYATLPVGYLSLEVPANADTTITPSLTRSPIYMGASTAINGDAVSASGLTAGAFASPNPACYLKVTSGPLEGMFFPITANSATSITVEAGTATLQSLGFASGNSFKVIPYWTLGTLFPNGAGIVGTSDVWSPMSFLSVSNTTNTGVNRSATDIYFYCTGDVENDLPAGWYNNADPFAGTVDNTLIDPTITYTVRSFQSSQIVVIGDVPSTRMNAEIISSNTANDNYLASPYPVDTSLQESGLETVIQATTDVFNPREFLLVYDDASGGFNKSASGVYFYCSSDVDNGLPAGWYDNSDPFLGTVSGKILKAGRCFTLRKAPSALGLMDWVAPLPYSP